MFSFLKHVAKNKSGFNPNEKDKNKGDSNDDSKVLQYEIFYKELQNNSVPAGGAFSFDKVYLYLN